MGLQKDIQKIYAEGDIESLIGKTIHFSLRLEKDTFNFPVTFTKDLCLMHNKTKIGFIKNKDVKKIYWNKDNLIYSIGKIICNFNAERG